MLQAMGEHMQREHICRREHGMLRIGRSLVQQELRMPEGKLRPRRGIQGPDS